MQNHPWIIILQRQCFRYIYNIQEKNRKKSPYLYNIHKPTSPWFSKTFLSFWKACTMMLTKPMSNGIYFFDNANCRLILVFQKCNIYDNPQEIKKLAISTSETRKIIYAITKHQTKLFCGKNCLICHYQQQTDLHIARIWRESNISKLSQLVIFSFFLNKVGLYGGSKMLCVSSVCFIQITQLSFRTIMYI